RDAVMGGRPQQAERSAPATRAHHADRNGLPGEATRSGIYQGRAPISTRRSSSPCDNAPSLQGGQAFVRERPVASQPRQGDYVLAPPDQPRYDFRLPSRRSIPMPSYVPKTASSRTFALCGSLALSALLFTGCSDKPAPASVQNAS